MKKNPWTIIAVVLALLLVTGIGLAAGFGLSPGHKSAAPAPKPTTHVVPLPGVRAPAASPSRSSPSPGPSTALPSPSPSTAVPAPPARQASGPLADGAVVCQNLALGCNGSFDNLASGPSEIYDSGDGSGYIDNLTWSDWGYATATGTGTLEVDDCNPDCAQGAFTGYPATVTLTGLTSFGSGGVAYSSATVSAPSAPAAISYTTYDTGLVPAGGRAVTQPNPAQPAPAGTSCDGSGLIAGADTSCPFAENVEAAYWASPDLPPLTVTAYSPVTGDTYSMYCTEASGEVACTGGNNALVEFPG